MALTSISFSQSSTQFWGLPCPRSPGPLWRRSSCAVGPSAQVCPCSPHGPPHWWGDAAPSPQRCPASPQSGGTRPRASRQSPQSANTHTGTPNTREDISTTDRPHTHTRNRRLPKHMQENTFLLCFTSLLGMCALFCCYLCS